MNDHPLDYPAIARRAERIRDIATFNGSHNEATDTELAQLVDELTAIVHPAASVAHPILDDPPSSDPPAGGATTHRVAQGQRWTAVRAGCELIARASHEDAKQLLLDALSDEADRARDHRDWATAQAADDAWADLAPDHGVRSFRRTVNGVAYDLHSSTSAPG